MNEIPTLYNNQEELCERDVVTDSTPHAINLSVYLDTGSGHHRRLLNVSELAELLGEEYCATLLGFCVFCGEYCTKQYLQEKGKVGPIRMMDTNPNCVQAIWRRMKHPTRSSPTGVG